MTTATEPMTAYTAKWAAQTAENMSAAQTYLHISENFTYPLYTALAEVVTSYGRQAGYRTLPALNEAWTAVSRYYRATGEDTIPLDHPAEFWSLLNALEQALAAVEKEANTRMKDIPTFGP